MPCPLLCFTALMMAQAAGAAGGKHTAVSVAAQEGHLSVVEALLAAGVAPDVSGSCVWQVVLSAATTTAACSA